MLFPAVSAAFRQSNLDPSPQVGLPKSDFLIQFLRSMPITLGLSLYLRASAIRHWKKSFSENLSLNQSPSPSLFEQHHCDTLVWLFSITISPYSVKARTVSSKISAAVFPKRFGFSLMSSRSMKLLSRKSCREKVRRTQFMPNFSRISLHSPFRGRLSSPPTQCRLAWPPDQFPPASLTLRPVRSTMRMPEVERGNCMSATSKRGSCDVNSCWSRQYQPMSYGFLQWFVLPIIMQNNSKKSLLHHLSSPMQTYSSFQFGHFSHVLLKGRIGRLFVIVATGLVGKLEVFESAGSDEVYEDVCLFLVEIAVIYCQFQSLQNGRPQKYGQLAIDGCVDAFCRVHASLPPVSGRQEKGYEKHCAPNPRTNTAPPVHSFHLQA